MTSTWGISHPWGADEVSFQDWSLPSRSLKKGYAKIEYTCYLAQQRGLDFAWVDTCCIDKKSSAELTESINSMFQWYQDAAVCYVYLEDLSEAASIGQGLAGCRWITRGWTLQELIAPTIIGFYDKTWKYRGSKDDFVDEIFQCTKIPREILLGLGNVQLYSVAERMSWASKRQTTRLEDIAYCLLGIFDVNMPLLYGEGTKAFLRLQEEIVKRDNDLTIFAWDLPQEDGQQFFGLFAPTPSAFGNSSGIIPFSADFVHFSVTNKGLFVSGDVNLGKGVVRIENDGSRRMGYLLYLGAFKVEGIFINIAICLRKFGPDFFSREPTFSLKEFGKNSMNHGFVKASNFYVLIQPDKRNQISPLAFRKNAIHVPPNKDFTLSRAFPERLWDITDQVFLTTRPSGSHSRYPTVVALNIQVVLRGENVNLVVLCDYRRDLPKCKMFQSGLYPRQEATILPQTTRKETFWEDLEVEAPEIILLGDKLDISVGGQVFSISVWLEKGTVESISREIQMWSLKLDIFTLTRSLPMRER